MANGKCAVHGGKTPVGLASPNLVTGRYSKYLPTRLLARYQESVADPELLALKDDIALLDTRLGEVLERLQSGEDANAWLLLGGAVKDLTRFTREAEDADEPGEALEQIGKLTDYIGNLVARALSEESAWLHARSLIKERADLVANERKRLVELQQYVTSERALLFVQAVMASVKQHVTEPTALRAIAADLARLSDVRDGSQLAGARG